MEGVVVAGGFSTRFGDADKAVADLCGTPMVRRVADRLAGVVDALVVNCRPEQVDAIAAALDGVEADLDGDRPVRFAEDTDPDRGPVAGVRTGLAAVDSEYAAVLACDLPFVAPALVSHLRDRADGHDAAVPRVDGWLRPTYAVYRAVPTVAACDRALDRGDRRARAPLSDLDCVVVEADDPAVAALGVDSRTFENVNTRADLAAAEAAVADERDGTDSP